MIILSIINGIFHEKGICELTYDNFKLKDNDKRDTCCNFPVWDTIQAKIIDRRLINNEEYYLIEFCADTWKSFFNFYVLESGIQKLNEFCYIRNLQMLNNKECVYEYIDNEVLDIAENLLNIAEENIMLNYRIVSFCHFNYSHLKSEFFKTDFPYSEVTTASYYSKKTEITYGLFFNTDYYTGKEKKNIEKFNDELFKKFKEFSKLIDNFAKIITEEKKVNEYIAKAVAWEAIQRKAIDYYALKWIDEYENILDYTFNELYMDFYQNINDIDVKYSYIENVLLCNEINIEHSQEILMYFLLSKFNIKNLILCDCFVKHYETIYELKQKIISLDIKQKLKTKQKRKFTKYTIDDIDLMTGVEFEKFIALLFNKMGYSSQVTKQSNDQGIDIIAIKNDMRIGVQAKRYSNTVGNSAIQEVVAGKSFYNCDKTVVATNSYFTTAAIELAQANNVILWDRDLLKEKIRELL